MAEMETVFRRYKAALIANTEFLREGQPVGRQSRTGVLLPEAWRALAAHVSLVRESP